MKADSKLKAAANAEARERHLRKKNEEAALDPFDEAGAPGETALPLGDVEAGEEEGLHVLRMELAPNSKAYALRAKWLGT